MAQHIIRARRPDANEPLLNQVFSDILERRFSDFLFFVDDLRANGFIRNQDADARIEFRFTYSERPRRLLALVFSRIDYVALALDLLDALLFFGFFVEELF